MGLNEIALLKPPIVQCPYPSYPLKRANHNVLLYKCVYDGYPCENVCISNYNALGVNPQTVCFDGMPRPIKLSKEDILSLFYVHSE